MTGKQIRTVKAAHSSKIISRKPVGEQAQRIVQGFHGSPDAVRGRGHRPPDAAPTGRRRADDKGARRQDPEQGHDRPWRRSEPAA